MEREASSQIVMPGGLAFGEAPPPPAISKRESPIKKKPPPPIEKKTVIPSYDKELFKTITKISPGKFFDYGECKRVYGQMDAHEGKMALSAASRSDTHVELLSVVLPPIIAANSKEFWESDDWLVNAMMGEGRTYSPAFKVMELLVTLKPDIINSYSNSTKDSMLWWAYTIHTPEVLRWICSKPHLVKSAPKFVKSDGTCKYNCYEFASNIEPFDRNGEYRNADIALLKP